MAEDEVIVAKKVASDEKASLGKTALLVVAVVGALAGILYAAIYASSSPSRPATEQTGY